MIGHCYLLLSSDLIDDMQITIADRFCGIRQHQLSAKIGISRSAVSGTENECLDLKISTAIKIAEALGYLLALVPLNSSQSDFDTLPASGPAMGSLGVGDDIDSGSSWKAD